MKGIGDRIRDLREARGWGQREFARKVGVSQPAVAFWELSEDHPDGTRPSPANLYKVAKLFGVTQAFLLFGDETEGQKRRRAA